MQPSHTPSFVPLKCKVTIRARKAAPIYCDAPSGRTLVEVIIDVAFVQAHGQELSIPVTAVRASGIMPK